MRTPTAPIFHRKPMNGLYGFLIVISPPEDVTSYVNELKSMFYKKYGSYEAMHSKPHITICNFPLLEERQEKVFSGLQNGLSQIDPFLLALKGFGSFPNSNVIYIDVEDSEELNSLREKFFRMNVELRIGKRLNLIDNYHLTIGKKLKPSVFESAKTEYLKRSYQNSFTVDKLKVLRFDFDARRYFEFGDLKLGD